jgi:hypothetical protein
LSTELHVEFRAVPKSRALRHWFTFSVPTFSRGAEAVIAKFRLTGQAGSVGRGGEAILGITSVMVVKPLARQTLGVAQ